MLVNSANKLLLEYRNVRVIISICSYSWTYYMNRSNPHIIWTMMPCILTYEINNYRRSEFAISPLWLYMCVCSHTYTQIMCLHLKAVASIKFNYISLQLWIVSGFKSSVSCKEGQLLLNVIMFPCVLHCRSVVAEGASSVRAAHWRWQSRVEGPMPLGNDKQYCCSP